MSQNIAFFCLGSSPGPITDTFKSIQRSSNSKEYYFICSPVATIDGVLNMAQYKIIEYSRNILGVFKLINNFLDIVNFVKKNNVEKVVFFSTLPINGLISRLLPKNISIYFWLHDPLPHSGESLITKIFKSIDEFLILGSNLKCIFVSANYLKNNIPSKYKKCNIEVVKFPYIDEVVAQKIEVQSIEYDITFFGRIEKYKGVEWFLKGVENNLEFFKNKKILIVGRGHINFNLNKFYGKKIDIKVLNEYVSNYELKKYLLKSKVCIFPYRDSTGSQAIQTAGRLGALIVATDVGSFREISIPEYSYFSDVDDIKEFLKNINLALSRNIDRKIISNAYSKFSFEDYYNNLLKKLAE